MARDDATIPGLSHLSVSGYRRLRSMNLDLRAFNVLIGANGVGKIHA